MRILVTGGTGVIGRPTIDRLLERGHRVRLLSRNAAEDAEDWQGNVEAFPADMVDPAALRGAADDCDVVLHIAGIVAEHPPEVTFEKVNVDGTRHLLAEAERAGVGRFLLVSSLGADRGESAYHRSKREAERLVERFPGEWLILRPGNVYGPGDEVISLLLKMIRTLPAIPTVGMGNQPFQPVWAEDLAEALVLAVERRDLTRAALDLAGEEVTSTHDLLDRIGELTDRHPPRLPVPSFLAEAGAGMAEALGIDIPVHTDQLKMLEEGNTIPEGGSNALTAVFGVRPTPLADGLATLVDSLPEQLPSEGTGDLRQHRYWADIRGSRLSAEELIRIVRDDFPSLPNHALLEVGAEPGTPTRMEEGETLTLALPMRGNIQIRVEEVTPTSITAATLEGHPLAGAVRFLAEEEEGEGGVRFEIRTYTRASNLVDEIAMRTLGEPLKGVMWNSVVESVVERSGGEAADGVQAESEVLDPDALERIEKWMKTLMRSRRSREEGGGPGTGAVI